MLRQIKCDEAQQTVLYDLLTVLDLHIGIIYCCFYTDEVPNLLWLRSFPEALSQKIPPVGVSRNWKFILEAVPATPEVPL